jgi:hypothetical protein
MGLAAKSRIEGSETVYFCTYLDSGYLTRGLALYSSLCRNYSAVVLYVVCMDDESYQKLSSLGIPGLQAISRAEFLRDDSSLAEKAETRTVAEFYFTCTPSVILFVLSRVPAGELLFYCDADVYFYGPIGVLVDDMGGAAVYITPHRFPESLLHLEVYGLFNVGVIGVRKCDVSSRCLEKWRCQCIDWCFDRVEDGKFADQKYLDDWPVLYENVAVSSHVGINVAPWNKDGLLVSSSERGVFVGAQQLICYHFQGLRIYPDGVIVPQFFDYGSELSDELASIVYVNYLRVLLQNERLYRCKSFAKRYVKGPTVYQLLSKSGSRKYWISIFGFVFSLSGIGLFVLPVVLYKRIMASLNRIRFWRL